MNRARMRLLLVCVVGLLLVTAAAYAQSGGGYDLSWNTVDGGGITFATGEGYELAGTMGQADAGILNGGEYELSGGFWGGVPALYLRYMPLMLK